MWYAFLADTVLVLHFAYVLFALFGGILSIWWRRIIWFHIPAALWAAFVEFAGRICPLTPLELWFRVRGGEVVHSYRFVERYILPILYPTSLTREIQLILGAIVVAVNLMIYWYIFKVRDPRSS